MRQPAQLREGKPPRQQRVALGHGDGFLFAVVPVAGDRAVIPVPHAQHAAVHSAGVLRVRRVVEPTVPAQLGCVLCRLPRRSCRPARKGRQFLRGVGNDARVRAAEQVAAREQRVLTRLDRRVPARRGPVHAGLKRRGVQIPSAFPPFHELPDLRHAGAEPREVRAGLAGLEGRVRRRRRRIPGDVRVEPPRNVVHRAGEAAHDIVGSLAVARGRRPGRAHPAACQVKPRRHRRLRPQQGAARAKPAVPGHQPPALRRCGDGAIRGRGAAGPERGPAGRHLRQRLRPIRVGAGHAGLLRPGKSVRQGLVERHAADRQIR